MLSLLVLEFHAQGLRPTLVNFSNQSKRVGEKSVPIKVSVVSRLTGFCLQRYEWLLYFVSK